MNTENPYFNSVNPLLRYPKELGFVDMVVYL